MATKLPKTIPIKKLNWCERGSSIFVSDHSFVAYSLVGKDQWHEICYNPDNYPCLYSSIIKTTEAKLAKGINKDLPGWFVRKCNIKGVNINLSMEVGKED